MEAPVKRRPRKVEKIILQLQWFWVLMMLLMMILGARETVV